MIYENPNKISINLVLFFTLIGSSYFANAHHSLTAGFDVKSRMLLRGTVNKFYLRNPHSFMFIKVATKEGKTLNYKVEFAPAARMKKSMGWEKNTLQQGDTVEISGYPAKNGLRMFATMLSQSEENVVLMNHQAGEQLKHQHGIYHKEVLKLEPDSTLVKHDKSAVDDIFKAATKAVQKEKPQAKPTLPPQ